MDQATPFYMACSLLAIALVYNQVTKDIPNRLDVKQAPKSRFGLVPVGKHDTLPQADGVDIIFVHGLGSNPDTTWQAPRRTDDDATVPEDPPREKRPVNWVSDFLPYDLRRGTYGNNRIYFYNYDSFWKREAVRTRLNILARKLLMDIEEKIRPSDAEPSRKLIFVAHSYGGLLVKQALVQAGGSSDYGYIAEQTKAILFLGTPHRGTNFGVWGWWAAQVLRPLGSNPLILANLEYDSLVLRDLHKAFTRRAAHVRVFNFFEQRPTEVFRLWFFRKRQFCVLEQSATYDGEKVKNVELSEDHYGLNKFGSVSESYQSIVSALHSVLSAAQIERGSCAMPLESPPKPWCTIPFARDLDFIDRETLLDQIHRTYSRGSARAALVGLGGVGKSQLAIEYCYRASEAAIQKNADLWVFWIHAETRARIEEDFKKLAEAVKLPGRKDPKADIPQLVEQWLWNAKNGPWLLVLDNADNAGVLFDTDDDATDTTTANSGRRALWTYLPQSPHGSILITSRNKDVAQRLIPESQNVIEVHPMDEGHALALLARKVGSQTDMDHCADLVEALEYMPLAISQAGAYIQQRTPRTSISKYLKEFRSSDRRKFSLLNQDKQSLRRDRNASNSVITTWQISFDAIQIEWPSAADLLSLMSFFDRQGIPECLVRPPDNNSSQDGDADKGKGDESNDGDRDDNDDNDASSARDASNSAFEEDLAVLRNYCLISMNKTGDVFEMHNLVQLAMRKWLSDDMRTETFKEEFISRIARAFPTGDYSNWATCEALFAHVEKAIDYRPIGGKPLEDWARILYNGSWYAQEQGRYSSAETMATKSLDARIETLGDGHELTWDSLSMVGETYRDQRKFEEAEKLFMKVMEKRKQKLGPAHPDTLTSMAHLASVFWHQDRWEKAEELQVEVMEKYKQEFGPDHYNTLTSIGDLALTYQQQDNQEEAEKLQVEVMEAYEKKFGPNHPDTLISKHNLAWTFWYQDRWEEAEKLEVEVLETRKREFGPNHPDTLISMASLASTWHSQKRITDAIDLMDSCAQKRRDVLGIDHPHTSSSIKTLETWRAEQEIPVLTELGVSDDVQRC